jgi:pimeloyl-ACP methyl ester carboxylesterase
MSRRTFPLIVATLSAAGCWQPPAPTMHQLDRGLIWMFPGVEGGAWSLEQPCRAFRDSGVDAAIRIHDWSKPFGLFVNLTAYQHNRADAARIASQIAAYQDEHPERPVDLVGYSGGGGMAIMVVEALPEGAAVRNVVLVQPALSPDYDLTAALRRIDRKLVCFYAPNDWWILGAGTAVFGTMDRRFTPSAGKDGFRVERALSDPALRERFVQHGWTGESLAAGHLGMHLGIIGYEWNRRFVAPLLVQSPQQAEPPTIATAGE